MRKNFVVVLGLAIFAAILAPAPAAAQCFTSQSSLRTKYMGQADGAIFHNEPVIQSTMTVSCIPNMQIEVWNSLSGSAPMPNFGRETDITVTVGLDLGKGFNASAGPTYMIVSPFQDRRGDVLVGQAALTYTIEGKRSTQRFFIAAEQCSPASGEEPGPGNFIKLGQNRELRSGHWSLYEATKLTFDSGAFGMNHAAIGRIELSAIRKVSRHLSLGAEAIGATPLTKVHDGRTHQLIPGVVLKMDF